jgi:hypothetical protein
MHWQRTADPGTFSEALPQGQPPEEKGEIEMTTRSGNRTHGYLSRLIDQPRLGSLLPLERRAFSPLPGF